MTLFSRSAAAAAALILLMPVAVPSHAQSASQVKAELQAIYNTQAAALKKLDSKGLFSSMSADYSETDEKGVTHNMAYLKTQMTQLFAAVKSFKGDAVVESVKVSGKTATAMVTQHGVIVMKSPQPMTVENTGRSKDTWVKTNGHWMATRSIDLSSKTLINGKPAPAGM